MNPREDIQDLMARYTMSGDRGDLNGLASCFADDGVLVFPGASATGRADIMAALSQGTPNPHLKRLRHHLTSSQITMESGQRATGRTYFLVITNAGPDHSGVYVDKFVRGGDGWQIARREVRIDWQSEASLMRRMVPGN